MYEINIKNLLSINSRYSKEFMKDYYKEQGYHITDKVKEWCNFDKSFNAQKF